MQILLYFLVSPKLEMTNVESTDYVSAVILTRHDQGTHEWLLVPEGCQSTGHSQVRRSWEETRGYLGDQKSPFGCLHLTLSYPESPNTQLQLNKVFYILTVCITLQSQLHVYAKIIGLLFKLWEESTNLL